MMNGKVYCICVCVCSFFFFLLPPFRPFPANLYRRMYDVGNIIVIAHRPAFVRFFFFLKDMCVFGSGTIICNNLNEPFCSVPITHIRIFVFFYFTIFNVWFVLRNGLRPTSQKIQRMLKCYFFLFLFFRKKDGERIMGTDKTQ